jgi:hypothetical protein
MIHKSVLRELLQNALSNYQDADDPDLEEELMEDLSTAFEIFNDEDDIVDSKDE